MTTRHPTCSIIAPLVGSLLAVLAGCASQEARATRLPFHVAMLPPATSQVTIESQPEASPTELVVSFEADELSDRLEAALQQRFQRVTRLVPPAGDAAKAPGWACSQAKAAGADLLLVPSLQYDPRVFTDLNDKFWLNLPLFALGGPFCWFVSDRSYHLTYAQLEAELYDVCLAASREGSLDATTRVMPTIAKGSTEASMNFLDRADGVGPYLLSIVCPAGLISPESSEVSGELSRDIADQLAKALAQSLQERSIEVTRSDLVDFEPRGVEVVRDGEQRFLRGEIVLYLGRVDELGTLRYRFDDGKFADASYGEQTDEAPAGQRRRKAYPFRIPVTDANARLVQLEVEQRDQRASRRTFTYAVAPVSDN